MWRLLSEMVRWESETGESALREDRQAPGEEALALVGFSAPGLGEPFDDVVRKAAGGRIQSLCTMVREAVALSLAAVAVHICLSKPALCPGGASWSLRSGQKRSGTAAASKIARAAWGTYRRLGDQHLANSGLVIAGTVVTSQD